MSDSPNHTNMAAVMAQLRMPEGCSLRRKETFDYVTPGYAYSVELFQNADDTWYAIAVPQESERLVVYGSSVLPSAQHALQALVDKIRREGMDQLFGDPTPPAAEDESAEEAENEEGLIADDEDE